MAKTQDEYDDELLEMEIADRLEAEAISRQWDRTEGED